VPGEPPTPLPELPLGPVPVDTLLLEKLPVEPVAPVPEKAPAPDVALPLS